MLVTLIGYSLFTLYVVVGLVTGVAVGCELDVDINAIDSGDSQKRVNNLLAFAGAVFVGTVWPVYVGYQLVKQLLPKFLAWMDS